MTQNKNGPPNRGDPNNCEEPAATGSWRDNLAGAANNRCMYVHSNRLTESRQDCKFLDTLPHFNNLPVDDQEPPSFGGGAKIQRHQTLPNHLVYTNHYRRPRSFHLEGAI